MPAALMTVTAKMATSLEETDDSDNASSADDSDNKDGNNDADDRSPHTNWRRLMIVTTPAVLMSVMPKIATVTTPAVLTLTPKMTTVTTIQIVQQLIEKFPIVFN